MPSTESITQAYQKAVENGFSGTVLVRHRGKIELQEAAGFANREKNIPNTVNTVFDIGSITKQYTAALIMALQEAGLLSVQDRLVDHFTDIPKDKADITIHQLLTHTAGFGDGFGADTVAIDRDVYLVLAWATRLEFEPGTRYRYSNAGYSIAAVIAEIASGQSYEAALKTYILAPANLHETGYVLPDWTKQPLAIGYRGQRGLEEMSAWDQDGPYWNLRGNGGLLTTASDLLKWHDVLSGESVLSATSIEALQSRHVDESLGREDADKKGVKFYGYGWVTQDDPSIGIMHWHTGGNGYFIAGIIRGIDEELVVIILSNEAHKSVEQLVDNLKELFTWTI